MSSTEGFGFYFLKVRYISKPLTPVYRVIAMGQFWENPQKTSVSFNGKQTRDVSYTDSHILWMRNWTPRNQVPLSGPRGTTQSRRKCICCPQTHICCILLTEKKKQMIFTESYLKKRKTKTKTKKWPESARFMFFPTKHPYSWTTGALELVISSLCAFDPLPTEPRTAQVPATALSQPRHSPRSRVPERIPECILGYPTSLTKQPLLPVIH